MEENALRIGHSPDPDDAFMFYALKHGKVDTAGFALSEVVEDIESLNQRALLAELEVTAISVHCYGYTSKKYLILPYGISMGEGYGPVIVAKEGAALEDLKGRRVAAPGYLTTAALLTQLACPGVELVHMPFDRIVKAVKSGEVEAGILIHEAQLTYDTEGLVQVLDLGRWWKEKKGLPLPLGINVVRRDLTNETITRLQRLFRESIEYGLAHREEALDYALKYGRGLARGLADQFVRLYVNEYALNLTDKGRRSIEILLEEAYQQALIPELPRVAFSDFAVD